MGPVTFGPCKGINVHPHPHIGLATVTYLFDGAILHRDSLGTELATEPGTVNWMVAGHGIVHSERTSEADLARNVTMEGIQAWIGLPAEHEETAPGFSHHPVDALPVFDRGDVRYRLIAGTAFGHKAPVKVFSPIFYLHGAAPAGAAIDLPDDHDERAVYVVDGKITADGETYGAGSMVVFAAGAAPEIAARADSRIMLLGGAALDGDRIIWWNFVSSDTDRLEAAKTR